MSIVDSKAIYTFDDLLSMPDGERFELVDGRLVETHVSNLSSAVAGRIVIRLGSFADPLELGLVLPSDAYYQCFPRHPGRARKPDASFIRKQRLPANWLAEAYFRIAPDLAVEVISPNDLSYEVEDKILEYLEAGVLLVWEVNPEQRVIYVHRLDGSVTKLRESDKLTGEDVIPGFSCPVGDLFPTPTCAAG